jgi:hypothetical protein
MTHQSDTVVADPSIGFTLEKRARMHAGFQSPLPQQLNPKPTQATIERADANN